MPQRLRGMPSLDNVCKPPKRSREVIDLRAFRFFTATILLALTAGPIWAQTALEVHARDGLVKSYSLEDLQAFAQATMRTSNEFVDGQVAFTGPLAQAVLEDAGVPMDAVVLLTAANDYQVEVDTKEFEHYGVILALTQDGKALSRRDKGPIWVMYPMSEFAELQDPVYNNRLVWQLVRIDEQ